jgi:integrase/recombinase XerD
LDIMVAKRSFNRLVRHQDTINGKAQVPTKKQFKNILWQASRGNLGKRNVALVWMLFGSGMRITEATMLKVSDLLQSSGELKGTFTIPSKYTKSGKARVAFILAKTHRFAMDAWFDEMVEGNAWLTGKSDYRGLDKDKPAFPTRRGKVWKPLQFQNKHYKNKAGEVLTTKVCSSMQNLISDLFKSSGLFGGSSHSGRRALATWLDSVDVELEVIQGILGHSDPEMTLAYIDVNLERIKQALNTSFSGVNLPDFGEQLIVGK